MKHTSTCCYLGKSAIRTSSHTDHGGIVSKRVRSWWAVDHTLSGGILCKSDRLSGTGSHTHSGRIVSIKAKRTVLDAYIAVAIHGWSRGTHQDTFLSGIVSKIWWKATCLAGSWWILSIVASWTYSATSSIRKIRIFRSWTSNYALSFTLVGIHDSRSARALKHTVVGAVIGKVKRWAVLCTCPHAC